MPPSYRFFILLAVAALGLLGQSGCSDAWVSSRDDQHTPSAAPPSWQNPLSMPGQSDSDRKY